MTVKIYYASDLHLENYEFSEDNTTPFYMYTNPDMIPEYKKSYLVLAGDICQLYQKDKFKTFFNIISRLFKAIIYVAGNHEYNYIPYSDILFSTYLNFYNNIYFLQNNFIEFPEDRIRFYGVTLWSDLDPKPENNVIAEKYGSDFKSIQYYNPLEIKKSKYITRNETAKLFEKQFTKLYSDLSESSTLKTIVVTHHTPLMEIIQPWIALNEEKNKPLASLYASDLKSKLINLNFDYWIFGHSHSTYQYELLLNNNKLSKFMSNPYGYFGSNKKFNINKFIEITPFSMKNEI